MPPLETEEEDKVVISNAFKNQHIVYVPRKKLNFNVKTSDGKMALIFESGEKSFDKRVNRWWKALSLSLPSIVAADYLVAEPT
jgi:hypothetical protein